MHYKSWHKSKRILCIEFLEQARNNYTHAQKHIPIYKDYRWIEKENIGAMIKEIT